MYINIALCDDEMEICFKIEKILLEIFDDLSIKYNIDVFCNGETLCKEMKKTEYDIVFLDIELPKLNGVQIGKFIRETLKNNHVQIAYISAKKEYAMELFDFRPINFLVKPFDSKIIKEKIIDKYMLITEQNNVMFTYKKKFNFYNIPYSKIFYFENNNRKITVTTNEQTDEFYDSMENIYKELRGHRFLFIHKSIIVNYNFITKLSYTEVEMIDGRIFPISQSRRKNISDEYMKIKKGENNGFNFK